MNHLMIQKKHTFRTSLAGLLALAMPAAFYVPAPPAAAAPAGTAKGDLDLAVSALRNISTMRVDFVQTDRTGQSISGVLTLKRPGRIRFQYEESAKLLIVGDGHALTLIDYEVNQVQRWPIKSSPLAALLDPERDVSRYGTLRPTGNPNVISVEIRDPRRPEYGVITLVFIRKATAPGGLELASWVALDSQNQRTTVRLANHRYGLGVPDSTFKFRDPRRTGRR